MEPRTQITEHRPLPPLVSLAVCLALLLPLPSAAQIATPDPHLTGAKQLIEANCGDCVGATQAGLEEGIHALQAAIDRGADTAESYALLAQAYGTLALVHLPPDSAAQREALAKQLDACRRVVELAPHDLEARYEYAIALGPGPAQQAALQEILEMNPDHARARFVLGAALADSGAPTQGMVEIERAIETETDPDARRRYRQRLEQIRQRATPSPEAERK